MVVVVQNGESARCRGTRDQEVSRRDAAVVRGKFAGRSKRRLANCAIDGRLTQRSEQRLQTGVLAAIACGAEHLERND